MTIELALFLENENDLFINLFSDDECLEKYLETINFDDWSRANIILYQNDEMNFEMSKIYKERYLTHLIT